jgi:ATP-dependent RNA helicase DeaD
MAVDTIEQRYFTVEHDQKLGLLRQLLLREQPEQAIVFCRTRRGTDKLQRKLAEDFPSTGCMHGDMAQRERDRVLQQMRDRKLKILVATDVVGRGIDVSTVSHIVNYDVPQDCDDYVHRVGRTGRMGREGIAFTFIVPGEGDMLTSIEQRINKQLIRDNIEGFDSKPEATRVAAVQAERQLAKELEPPPSRRTLNPMHRKVTRRR